MGYLENPNNSWETCLKNKACWGFTNQDAWGQQKLQLAYLVGRSATKAALATINDIEHSGDTSSLSHEEKEDI